MTWHLWLVYVGVIIVLIAVPGPSALISMTHGLRYGQRRALSTVLGSASASLVLMTASALGLGAILAASASAFLGAESGRGALSYLAGDLRLALAANRHDARR
ncbi:LysE family transporter [Dickeya lacustris]|uniref:LysE family transporter n=1 Tax=Dickeya lacustris TaxID=2259638 RepID=A0ABY8G0F0_9GAMM|nr:LysE family transporter [Dickeya lacustris]WFN54056.1 LysE family transporter [Dickeya lacustris]